MFLGWREPFRVGFAFGLRVLIFFGTMYLLMLSGLPLVLKIVLMVFPTLGITNWIARVLTGIDLQRRWFQ